MGLKVRGSLVCESVVKQRTDKPLRRPHYGPSTSIINSLLSSIFDGSHLIILNHWIIFTFSLLVLPPWLFFTTCDINSLIDFACTRMYYKKKKKKDIAVSTLITCKM